MYTTKMISIVLMTIAVALSVSSVSFTSHVFAQKDDSSNSGSGSSDSGSGSSNSGSGSSDSGSSSGSGKGDYDKFQSCLSDASNGGSATKQQIRDCFDSTFGGGSSSSSSDTNDNSGGSKDTGNSPNDSNNDASN